MFKKNKFKCFLEGVVIKYVNIFSVEGLLYDDSFSTLINKYISFIRFE